MGDKGGKKDKAKVSVYFDLPAGGLARTDRDNKGPGEAKTPVCTHH